MASHIQQRVDFRLHIRQFLLKRDNLLLRRASRSADSHRDSGVASAVAIDGRLCYGDLIVDTVKRGIERGQLLAIPRGIFLFWERGSFGAGFRGGIGRLGSVPLGRSRTRRRGGSHYRNAAGTLIADLVDVVVRPHFLLWRGWRIG